MRGLQCWLLRLESLLKNFPLPKQRNPLASKSGQHSNWSQWRPWLHYSQINAPDAVGLVIERMSAQKEEGKINTSWLQNSLT